MTRVGRFSLLFAVLVLAILATQAGEPVTLAGEFVWQRTDGNHDGEVEAIFTPTAPGTWDVAFHFEWEDGPHVYQGTATGDLSTGTLAGEVENDNPDRKGTFRFTGMFEDGKFSGTHGVLQEDGTLRDTGTIRLARPTS